jgi:hypothetical protein
MTTHNCKYEDKIARMSEQVDDIHRRLFIGNGSPSMATRLDRLEQAAESRSRHWWAIYPLVVGALLTAAVALWQGQHEAHLKSPSKPQEKP